MPAQNDVQLTITVDDQGSKQINSIVRMLQTLQKSVAATAKSFAAIDKSTESLNRSLGKTTSSTQKFEDRLDRLQKQFNDTKRATDQAEGSMLDYSEALSRVAAGLARVRDFGARQLTAFVQAASRLEDITTSYRSILGSAAQAADAVDDLRQAAQDPGLTFEVAARAAQRFLALGLSLEEAIQLTRNFANAAVVSGTSTAELNTGLQQLAKAIAAGKLEMEDLTSLSERFLPIGRLIRQEWGKTGEDVTNAIEKANLSMGEFFLLVSNLERQPKAGADTLSNAISNLVNAFNEFSSTIGTILSPAVKAIVGTITDLLNTFNELPDAIQKLITFTATLTVGITALATAAVATAGAIGVLSVALGGLGIGAGAGLAGAAGGAAFSIGGLAASLGTLTPYLVGGAAITASVAALATTIYTLVDAANDAKDANNAFINSLEDVDSLKGYNAELKRTREEMERNVGTMMGLDIALEGIYENAKRFGFVGTPGGRGLFNLFRSIVGRNTENIVTESERNIRQIQSLVVDLEGTNEEVINRLTKLITQARMQYDQLRLSGREATDEEVKATVRLIQLLEKELKTRQDIQETIKEAERPQFTPAPTPRLPRVDRPDLPVRRAQLRDPITRQPESPQIFRQSTA